MKLRFVVPLICDPAPQTSFRGRPTAVSPARVAVRSSVKKIDVAVGPDGSSFA